MRRRFGCEEDLPLRHCVEIRHESFVVPEFVDLLREHDIGLVVADTVEWPLLMDVTSDFVYCRCMARRSSTRADMAMMRWIYGRSASRHGRAEANPRAAEPAQLERKRGRGMSMFTSTMTCKVRAPFDAQGLRSRVDKLLGTTSTRSSPASPSAGSLRPASRPRRTSPATATACARRCGRRASPRAPTPACPAPLPAARHSHSSS